MISCLSKEITDTVQRPGMDYRMLGSLVTKLQTNIFRLQVLPEGPYQIYSIPTSPAKCSQSHFTEYFYLLILILNIRFRVQISSLIEPPYTVKCEE